MKTFLTIRDKGGSVIWNAETIGPLAYLREGDVFWYGSADSPNWVRVVGFTCGLDMSDGCLKVELVVEVTASKSVPARKPKKKTVDYGEKWLSYGETWAVGNGIKLHFIEYESVFKYATLVIETVNERARGVERRERIHPGEAATVQFDGYAVTASYVREMSGKHLFRLVEQIEE